MSQGQVLIISGPSGVGKSTVVHELLRCSPVPMLLSTSATTRDPRPGEVDGRDYLFLSDEEFARRREQDDFLECKEVFGRGYWYGTLKSTVSTGISDGKWVLLEIDVEGALSVKEVIPAPLMIFLHPGSMQTLEQRLRDRKSDSEESIQRRLEVARDELSKSHLYDYVIVNENVSETVAEICQIVAQAASNGEAHA